MDVVTRTFQLGHDVVAEYAGDAPTVTAVALLADGHGSTRLLADAAGRTRGAMMNRSPANMILDLRVRPGGLNAATPLVEYGKQHNVTVLLKEFPR